jgi:hypothetical protein
MQTITAEKPDLKILGGLLANAFEGANSGWLMIEDYRKPTNLDFLMDGPGADAYPHVDYPLNEGGIVYVQDVEAGKTYELTLDSCITGWHLLQEQESRHWMAALTGNDDAETADTFLQLCLFGEVLHG